MNKGTIIYVGGFSLPDKNAAANRVVSNGKLFKRLGYETVFLGTSYEDENFDSIRKIPGQENMYEEPHPVTSSAWVRHLFDVEKIKTLVNEYKNVKMVILYNVPVITLFNVKRMFAGSGIKIIYDCTEWTKDTDGSFIKKVFKWTDEFFVSHFAHKLADGMIVISRMMEKAYKSNKKLLRLPPLVDTEDEIWHQTPEKNSGFEFCFAGIPDGKKESLDKVVEGFSLIDNSRATLRIVGITSDEFKSLYPDLKINNEAFKKITFMGKVSHKDAVKYILGCDCYLFIRQSDRRNNAGFPTKFAESFTCSVPIITTDVSDVGEYIKKSGRGTVLNSICPEDISGAMSNQMNAYASRGEAPDKTFYYASYISEAEKWFQLL